jgi:hypothetical protein
MAGRCQVNAACAIRKPGGGRVGGRLSGERIWRDLDARDVVRRMQLARSASPEAAAVAGCCQVNATCAPRGPGGGRVGGCRQVNAGGAMVGARERPQWRGVVR